MALWIILGIALVLLLCLLVLRIGIVIEYTNKGFNAILHAGFIRIRLYPSKDKGKEKEKKSTESRGKREADSEKKGGKIEQFRELLSIISEISKKLDRRYRIDTLTLYYMAAGEDAAKTALSFGTASLISGLVLPILDNSFTVKEKDIRTAVSFTESESYVYFKTKISIAVRIIPYIAVIIGYRYKHMIPNKDKRVATKKPKSAN